MESNHHDSVWGTEFNVTPGKGSGRLESGLGAAGVAGLICAVVSIAYVANPGYFAAPSIGDAVPRAETGDTPNQVSAQFDSQCVARPTPTGGEAPGFMTYQVDCSGNVSKLVNDERRVPKITRSGSGSG